MSIPRIGRKYVVLRGKAKRKTTVVITGLHRREMKTGKFRYQVYYKTDGTWARHGERTHWIRAFLKFATQVGVK